MSFIRSFLLVSLVSLLAASGLLVLGSAMGYDEFRGGYAVMSADASVDDRTLLSLLESGGNNFGGSPVCESSQWVMLDEFDSIKAIPLDSYFSRVASFDPRNDGYAGKLRDVFIRDGRRFVYIPLKAGNWNSALLDKQFKDMLGDIFVSIEYYGAGRPLKLFFIAYAAASVFLLVICFLKRKSNPGSANIIVLVPIFSSLAFFGASGIAAAALLFALFILLKEPLNDLAALTGSLLKKSANKFKLIQKEVILPYRFYWLFMPVFALAFAGIVFFSQLKLLFLLAVFAAASAVFFFSLKILSLSGGMHRRFTPVLIMRRCFPEFAFSFYMLPFAAAAFITLFLMPFFSGSYVSNGEFDALITEQDYYDHLAYQASFSTRQIGASSSAYPAFFFDADGLPSMNMNPGVKQTVNVGDFPPFPLKHLVDFFHSVDSGGKTAAGPGGGARLTEILTLLVLLLFIFPGFFIRKKYDYPPKINFPGLKRFSAKLRLKGINWNKTLVYNDRNALRLRKDA
jgi:hypothetical protein